ncbi:MAG: outer membrane protein assembly factor BamD [Gammaproteobacteria bacterium]|nr:outer membrane protein assembly factor BamD [Gammaproteobacteria bacterium]
MVRYSGILIGILAYALLAGCAFFKSPETESANWSVEEFYREANGALLKERYQYAIETYQRMESRFPYGPHAEQAQLEIGYAHYKNGEPEAAIAAADRFIRLHPTHPNVDYAFYLKGLVNFHNEQSILSQFGISDVSDRDPRSGRDSFDAFRDLISRYPESRYAEDSRQRMAFLLNTLAKHDVQVADYYMRRGAYVAVVNRCKHVVENYQRTPAVEDALGMMARAYRKMGMQQLAADTLMILEANFPNSRYQTTRAGTTLVVGDDEADGGFLQGTASFFKRLFGFRGDS